MQVKKFSQLDEPWCLEDRLERMRFLIENLVWHDQICQVFVGNDWMISTSNRGVRLIALWPDAESAKICLSSKTPEHNFKILSGAELEKHVLDEMYDDEFIAAFPNEIHEYEILDVEEFRKAVQYATLVRKGFLGELTEADSEKLAKNIFLTRKD